MTYVLPDLFSHGMLIGVIHVILGGAVTIHVLLRRRSVRAAIAWIGVAWLSPLFGATAYYFFGINRVARRASRLRQAINLRAAAPQGCAAPEIPENIGLIARVVKQLTGQALTGGNSIVALECGDKAYPAMLSAIRNARHSIAFASYIFRADRVGRLFIKALCEAQARGVHVRVLIDGIGGGYFYAPAVRALRREGVTVARFLHNRLPWRMPYLNMRSHKKILVVDGRTAFTGGMNIADENVIGRHPEHPVSDIHFRVEGPAVRHLMETFSEDWGFTTGEMLDDDVWWPELHNAGSVWARGISSGPDEQVGILETVLAAAIFAANKRLRIVTPYFLPDEKLMYAIEWAALRGLSIDILIPERSDHRVLDWAMGAHLRQLPPGISIYRVSQPFSHAKLMTVDGHWCLIGTANWDTRSTRLNFEFNLEAYSRATTAEIDGMIDARIAVSHRVPASQLATQPLALRLRDAAARLMLPYL
ncbi:MAG: phospholipase D-like domain-containing protein [Alphaproteobacteria bacterium]